MNQPGKCIQQIFVILRNKIYSGELSAGERVESEQELCSQFGVSRITARRALGKLAESGLVERRRGSGTRVAAQADAHRPVMASMDGLIENVLKALRAESGAAQGDGHE